MADIDKILNEALKGYEAPYDPAMWDKVSSQLSPMEDAFRDTLENHEAPYHPKAWSSIKNKIGGSSNVIQWIAGSAAALGIVAAAIVFLPGEEESVIDTVSRVDNDPNETIAFTTEKTEENLRINPIYADRISNEESLANDETENSRDNDRAGETVLDDNNAFTVNSGEGTNTDLTNDTDSNSNNDTDVADNTDDNGTTNPPVDYPTDNSTDVIATKYSAIFSTSATEICQGERILFNPKMVKRGVIYTWDFGDGNSGTKAATAHTYEKSGTFTVILNMLDEKTHQLLDSYSETIVVNKLPQVVFESTKSNENIPTITFTETSDELTNWIWKVDGKMVSDRQEFEYTFREKGAHTVALSSKTAAGCENEISENIAVENDYNLFAKNAFAPNGNGQYDNFMPGALMVEEPEFIMNIYNQAGELIFTTSNAYLPWKGQMDDNSEAPGGMYVWTVQLKNGNGTYENYNGQVLLIR